MNLAHAMFSFALGLSALAASLARSAGWPPDVVFPLLAAVVLALGLITREPVAPHHAAPARPAGAPADGAWPVILPVAAVLFLCFVAENSIEAWSALHVERTLGAPAGQGGFGPTMLGLTMGVARLGGHYAVTRLGETGLILWSVALAGIALMGFGVAVVVPTANSILGRLVRPDQRGQAISRAWMIGFTGFFLGPVMMGQISEVVGLRAAFAVIAALVALIAPFVLILRARGG
jgi:dipeptide/tripeptide permease